MRYGYIIANVDVTDPEQYEAYKCLSTIAIETHGAEPLVRGGRSQLLEGQMHARIVVLRFPSFDAARAFYDSDEYRAARAARESAARMNMMVVEGLD